MANVIGQRVRRREDPRFLTGAGLYVDDVELPGAKRVTFVRSDWAHAKILGIDTSAAAEIPGTRVFTAADVDLPTNPLPPFLGIDEPMQRPFLASDTVRFVGDIVAIVVSDGRELGVDAAELVDVEYDALPVVTNLRDAARDEVLLFPDVGTNVCMRQAPASPDEHLFDDRELVPGGRAISTRTAACPIEPRSSAAALGDDGRLTVWLCSQTPHQDRNGLAGIPGLEPQRRG